MIFTIIFSKLNDNAKITVTVHRNAVPGKCLPHAIALLSKKTTSFPTRRRHIFSDFSLGRYVHMMMTLLPKAPILFKVMQDLKKFTGLHCNRYLGREGSFWEEESYDHIVRSELEFYRILNYILRNPIKAKFVKEWQRWPFTFAKPELL